MSYHPYGGGGPYAPPGYGGFPGGVPGGVPGGMQGGMPAGMPMNAPPGMVPPGLGPPPGMHTSNPAHTSRQPGLPIGFQPPANLPNINFNARVIRLGTSSKPSANGSSKDTDSPSSAHPGNSRTNGVIDRTEQSRVNAREAAQALVPPMPDEKLRTIFIGNIPEGANGTAGIEALLGSVGRLQRFDSSAPFQADKSELLFGFAQFEDAESVAAAIALLKDIELPTKKQSTPETEPIDTNDKFEGIDKTKLIVAVDEITIKYLDSKLTNESAKNARIESVRPAVKKAVRKLFYPPADTKDKATEQPTSEAVEVVNINLAQDDELADIPAEMREMVAGEIAAFRERSTQRDLERMKREEELEERERLRNNPNNGRTRSPLRGIPTGPKAANGRTNQIAFISSGLSHADLALYRDHDETDASDEELNRRELQKKKGEQDNQYFDAERKWVSRERSRTAALERERDRERHDAESFEKRKQEVLDQEREWDDAKERESKSHAYYRDHANWARKRALDRADEAARDEGDRQAEAEETRREKKDQDKARGLADSFLEAAGKEMAAGGAAAAVATTTKSAAPVAPQPFKLSLGAAAQKAQAQRNGRQRRTVAEVEGLLDDEEHEQQTKRQLVPIQFEASAADGMTEEEVQQAVKQLAGEIPVDKEGLWGWKVKWEYLDEEVIVEKLRPFVQKKIVEYLGVQEEVIVEVIEEHLRKHGGAGELVEELAEALDEVAEDLVKKLWRMVIFFTESEKRGLPA